MMRSALAIRTYTETQIKPLLDGQNHYKFLPQTCVLLRDGIFSQSCGEPDLRDYGYKEATLNRPIARPRGRLEWTWSTAFGSIPI